MAKARGFQASAGTKVGLEIWRIEKMDVVLCDTKDAGQFHTGDCYIVMNTFEGKDGRRNQDLHFWLGEKSTQDEQGAVAYKTVELDTKLGGKPVQHREVQGYESKLFLSYFPKGIQYLEGGVETAFRHVDPTKFDPRLFHLKGKRNVRVQQVDRKASSLNQGDVFILDLGLTLYQWNGSGANKYEKFKALELITNIKNSERGGKAKLIFLEHDTKNADAEAFYKALGGSDGIKSAEAGGSDDDVKAADPVTLFRVSDASGSLKVDKVADTKLERKMLDANDVFIVDSGAEVFVWVGDKATKQEREKSMEHAAAYLKSNNRPAWVPITRIIATGETPPFKSLFQRWDEPKKVVIGDSKDAKAKPAAAADTSALYKKQQAASEKMVDNATGKLTVWRIKNLKKEEIPKEEYGQFFAGDSYIVLYAYKKGTKDAWVIYFWQGRDSSSDEKAASALLTVDLDDALGGEPVQVRVTQGAEPQHFLALFKGKMVIHDGGYTSGFNNRKEEDVKQAPVALYHIHGQTEINTYAVQTALAAASLNSGDCFALNTPSGVYSWIGKGANDAERKAAGNIAKVVGGVRKVTAVDEGKEPEEFWTALGGKGEYPNSKELAAGNVEPRLFHCTTAKTGAFRIDEIFNFSQDDLINDDVIILDAFSEVFVWVGHDSTKEERDQAFKAALEYVKNINDGRNANTPVFKVVAGSEPPNFTCHFHGWDDKKASSFEDPYAKALSAMGGAKLGAAGAAAGSAAGDAKSPAGGAGASKFQVKVAPQAQKKVPAKAELVTAADIGFADWKSSKATADEVRNGKVANMDMSVKELYVNDAEFATIFKMDKAAWQKLPAWKRTQAKQTARLF